MYLGKETSTLGITGLTFLRIASPRVGKVPPCRLPTRGVSLHGGTIPTRVSTGIFFELTRVVPHGTIFHITCNPSNRGVTSGARSASMKSRYHWYFFIDYWYHRVKY